MSSIPPISGSGNVPAIPSQQDLLNQIDSLNKQINSLLQQNPPPQVQLQEAISQLDNDLTLYQSLYASSKLAASNTQILQDAQNILDKQ